MKKKKTTIPPTRSFVTIDKDSIVMKSTFQEAMALLGTFQQDLKDILGAILLHKDALTTSGCLRPEDLQLYEKCEQVSIRQNSRRGSKTPAISN